MRVLGVDPGLVDTGYGVLERRAHGLEILATWVVNADPRLSLEGRLAHVGPTGSGPPRRPAGPTP